VLALFHARSKCRDGGRVARSCARVPAGDPRLLGASENGLGSLSCRRHAGKGTAVDRSSAFRRSAFRQVQANSSSIGRSWPCVPPLRHMSPAGGHVGVSRRSTHGVRARATRSDRRCGPAVAALRTMTFVGAARDSGCRHEAHRISVVDRAGPDDVGVEQGPGCRTSIGALASWTPASPPAQRDCAGRRADGTERRARLRGRRSDAGRASRSLSYRSGSGCRVYLAGEPTPRERRRIFTRSRNTTGIDERRRRRELLVDPERPTSFPLRFAEMRGRFSRRSFRSWAVAPGPTPWLGSRWAVETRPRNVAIVS
jgi:hypothetical protein